MRILIFHGYLLSGTGSNVYNACLAEALVGMGHEVHLLCQERHPERFEFARSERCTIYRPDIGGLLPVYVHDTYEGVEARTFAACSDEEVAAYVRANVEAVREVAARVEPHIALANHLVMGPAILARGLEGRVPYAVKVHGSALEYTVKPEPERFLPYAREGLARAGAVLVGSMHTARSLWSAMGDPALPSRTRLGPPGVDVERFAPRNPEQAERALADLVEGLRAGRVPVADAEGAFARDERAVADALERVLADRRSRRVPGWVGLPFRYRSPIGGEGELVAFVGKLIAAKGVDLLLAAWPLVLQRRPRARLLVIGFGSERERYEQMAAPLADRAIFTGRLDHDELPDVLRLCEALVVPSTFPEAFGMVAVEAAACGVLPISAAHSGLAEVSKALAEVVPAEAQALLSFPIGGAGADDLRVRPEKVAPAIATRVLDWLEADPRLRARTREALVSAVRARWSWEGVARGVIAAAVGDPESPLARTVE